LDELEKKILWQCRRGLWELDAILIPFVEKYLSKMDETEIDDFRKLLAYEDIEIFDILVNKKPFVDKNLGKIVEKINRFQDSNLGD
tara:strand:+ start:40 stop:297 length:258 start_codon:yes stop_codon:yes gene_type:complete